MDQKAVFLKFYLVHSWIICFIYVGKLLKVINPKYNKLANCPKVVPFLAVRNTYFKFLGETCKLIIIHLLSSYDKKASQSSFSASEQSENLKMYINVKFWYLNLWKLLTEKPYLVSCVETFAATKIQGHGYQTNAPVTQIHHFGYCWLFSTYEPSVTERQIFKWKLTVINF